MQKLECVHPLIEKIAKQEYNLNNIVGDIKFCQCIFIGPELGCIVLVRPWK